MLIHVCHVRRKNIPDFVFPGGIRPPPTLKPVGELLSAAKAKSGSGRKRKQDDVALGTKAKEMESINSGLHVEKIAKEGIDADVKGCSNDARLLENTSCPGKKRKQDDVALGTNSKEIESIDLSLPVEKRAKEQVDSDVKGISNDGTFPENTSCSVLEVEESVMFGPPVLQSASSSGSPEPGKANIVRENTNGPFVGHGSPVKELDERENDDGLTNQVQGFIGSMKVGPIAKQEVATEGKGASSSSKWLQNGGLDELEVFTADSFNLRMCAVWRWIFLVFLF